MPYRIKLNYDTGDTFGREPGQEDYLRSENHEPGGYVFENLNIAQFVLQRLKEHYEWYCDLNSYKSRYHPEECAPKPKWLIPHKEDWWFNAPNNDGADIKFSALTYCGYFDSLNWAEIESIAPEFNPNRVDFR